MATNQPRKSHMLTPEQAADARRKLAATGLTLNQLTGKAPLPIPQYMVTSSDGEVTSYHTKAEAQELWEACIHRNFHEPTHCATLTEGDTITGFYARVDGVVLHDSRLTTAGA